MPSLKFSLLAAATAVISVVRADYYINPDSVSLTVRKSWCSDEISTCPLICEQTKPYTTEVNTCDPTTLTYGCVCGNGLQPNVSEYSLTLPYFVCQEWGNQCVTACGSDNSCSSDCREKHPCGAQNPTLKNETSASASASTATATGAATTSNQVYNGFSGATSTSASTASAKHSFATLTVHAGQAMGLSLTLAGLVAGFALLL